MFSSFKMGSSLLAGHLCQRGFHSPKSSFSFHFAQEPTRISVGVLFIKGRKRKKEKLQLYGDITKKEENPAEHFLRSV